MDNGAGALAAVLALVGFLVVFAGLLWIVRYADQSAVERPRRRRRRI